MNLSYFFFAAGFLPLAGAFVFFSTFFFSAIISRSFIGKYHHI